MSGGDKPFASFEAKYGANVAVDVMERIADAIWNQGQGPGIERRDLHQINACNFVFSGSIEHDGQRFGFVIESGDRNGTVIYEWGLAEDVGLHEPQPQTLYTFVPQSPVLRHDRPSLWTAYIYWRDTLWFKDMERGYNYDRHFAPGSKTESYYRNWAATKGLMIASQEEFERLRDEPRRELVDMAALVEVLTPIVLSQRARP